MSEEINTVLAETESLLTIPWFLSCKNPEVMATRAKSQETYARHRQEVAAKRTAPVKISQPAKSAMPAPAEKPESKPEKLVKAAAPKKAAAFADDAVITVLTEDFKHREGSQAADKSALFETGQTVAEYVAAGEGLKLSSKWQMLHIKNAVAKGQIKVEG